MHTPHIDGTFEAQFRTVFSEGWHEIEHDLRYKRKKDWENSDDLSRTLNGIIATLETCDWAAIKIFDDLSQRMYNSSEINAMINAKFRLRVQESKITESSVIKLISTNSKLKKSIFRVNRSEFMNKLLLSQFLDIPINAENIVFLCNRFFIQSDEIKNLEPTFLKDVFEQITLANNTD